MKSESLQAFLSILQHIIKPIVDYVKQTIEGRKKKRRTKSGGGALSPSKLSATTI